MPKLTYVRYKCLESTFLMQFENRSRFFENFGQAIGIFYFFYFSLKSGQNWANKKKIYSKPGFYVVYGQYLTNLRKIYIQPDMRWSSLREDSQFHNILLLT